MPDDTESLAVQIREFFFAVEGFVKAVEGRTSEGSQTHVGQPPRSPPSKEDIVTTYSRCLEKLEEDERATLGQLIDKLFGALRDLRSKPQPKPK